jgi:hypothetical protein
MAVVCRYNMARLQMADAGVELQELYVAVAILNK